MQFYRFLLILIFLTACKSSSKSEQEIIDSLSINERVEVQAIDAKISELQSLLTKLNMQSGKDDDKASKDLLPEQWGAFANSVELAGHFREQANALREQIIELQRRRQEILQNNQ